jgi:enoyl-CoA hydratase/carnithine racemase
MTSGPGRIITSIEGSIALLTFDNRARRNALSKAMWEAIPDALESFERDRSVRAIVVSGAGDAAFAAGADISEFESERASAAEVQSYEDAAERAIVAFAQMAKPCIAKIHGFCIGGGLALALACDLRIAADDAVFAIPAARLGLGYSFPGVKRIVRVIGPAFAKEMFFTARRIDTREALQMGLVNQVVTKQGLDTVVLSRAREIAQNAPLSIRAAKLAIEAVAAEGGDEPPHVSSAIAACFASRDYVEGRRAFMAKRSPTFLGE